VQNNQQLEEYMAEQQRKEETRISAVKASIQGRRQQLKKILNKLLDANNLQISDTPNQDMETLSSSSQEFGNPQRAPADGTTIF
jgi:hypothetical protein